MKINEQFMNCNLNGFDEAIEKVNQLNSLLREAKGIIDSLPELEISISTDVKSSNS